MELFNLPASCLPNQCFCESIRINSIAQLVNSWSSLAFVAVAFILLLFAYRKKAKFDWLDWSFATTFTITGLGSFYYHAKLTFIGQTVDVLGMYLLVTLALFAILYFIKYLTKQQSIIGYFLTNVALLISLVYYPMFRRYLFALLVACTICTLIGVKNRLPHSRMKYFWGSLVALTLGYTFWIIDIQKIFCNPDSVIQGHAIWHILSASSALLIYLFVAKNRTWQDA